MMPQYWHTQYINQLRPTYTNGHNGNIWGSLSPYFMSNLINNWRSSLVCRPGLSDQSSKIRFGKNGTIVRIEGTWCTTVYLPLTSSRHTLISKTINFSNRCHTKKSDHSRSTVLNLNVWINTQTIFIVLPWVGGRLHKRATVGPKSHNDVLKNQYKWFRRH